MSNSFTPRAQQALATAKKEALRLRHNYIGTEHILLGLIKIGQGLALKIIQELGVDPNILSNVIEEETEKTEMPHTQNELSMTPRVKKVISFAEKEAKRMQHQYVGTEHLLLGLLKETEGAAAQFLSQFNVDFNNAKEQLLRELDPNQQMEPELVQAHSDSQTKSNSKTPALKTYGTDLTARAAAGELDPVVGRENEIERVIQILCRKTKNNPVLIGEAGVGKTAIAEGLAQKIASKTVPDLLYDKKIIMLDLALIVAGTTYRGQFEERIKNIMNEVKKNKNIILFVDELHMIVGAGSASGSMDASNIFKPALSRGELQLIGATTLNEFRKYIEKDSALERRFQQVIVEAPTIEQTIQILKGIRPKYEQHHKATFLDEALEAAAKLSERYLTNRSLPDKAIDLIDEAGSKARIDSKILPPDVTEIEKDIEKLNNDKQQAIKSQQFELAASIRDDEKKKKQLLEETIKNWTETKQNTQVVIDKEQIASVLSKWTGIPLSRIDQKDAVKLLSLEEELSKKVIGQKESIIAVSKAMRRARANLKDPKRPIGSFLFLGPTGVGKTFLTQTIAELMFGTKDSIIQIDMSEYMEKFSVSRLIGSPPGYIGYEEGGQLTEQVRRKPYSVVLFDEVEKAHPDALHILLQILEEGKVTDSLGRKINFQNTIIILTSNVGAVVAKKQTTMGFGVKSEPSDNYAEMKEKILVETKQYFKPELLNRIDETIVFRSLDKEDLTRIVELEAQKVFERLSERQITLMLSDSAKEFLIEKGYDVTYGARPMRRAIEKYIEDPLSEELIKETFKNGDIIFAEKNKEAEQLTFKIDVGSKKDTSIKKKSTRHRKG